MPLDTSLVGERVIGVAKESGSIAELTLQKADRDDTPEKLAKDAVDPKGGKPRPLGVGIKVDVFA